MEVKNKQLAAAVELYKSAESDDVREQAIGIIEAMANADDVTACLILGANYDPSKEKGFVERDESKALLWYKKAAELGDAKGANEAAILLFRGSSAVQDKTEAANYIKKAVELDPENEVYQKNLSVIAPPPAQTEPEAEDEGRTPDAPSEKVEKPEGETTIIEGTTGNLMILNIACAIIIIACGAVLIINSVFLTYIIPFLILAALVAFLNLRMAKCSITVTNRRVSGRISFQRLIDMPLDCISSVGTCAFGGVKVTAASCKCAFYLIENADDIRSAIAGLLIKRQEDAAKPGTIVYQEIGVSSADEIKKLGELLERGVITQEEFDGLKEDILKL